MSAAAAERRAETLVKSLEIPGPLVDVHHVAAELGLRIVEDDLGDDVSGALVMNANGAAILVQEGHPHNRKRFTIAHEIGHHVLGHQFEEGGHVHVDRGNYISLRGRRASEGVDPKEVEANRFAAALLMPSEMVKRAVASLNVAALHDQHVEQLASLFEVSQQAMTIRLTTLRLL